MTKAYQAGATPSGAAGAAGFPGGAAPEPSNDGPTVEEVD